MVQNGYIWKGFFIQDNKFSTNSAFMGGVIAFDSVE